MNSQETVKTLMNAVQEGNFKKARSLLAREFRFSGAVPEPLGAGPWIGLSANLKTAIPNLNYHFAVKSGTGSVVKVSSRLTGTHTVHLNLTSMMLGIIPATGKTFAMDEEEGEVTVRDGLVSGWKVRTSEGTGLLPLLAQLTGKAQPNPMQA